MRTTKKAVLSDRSKQECTTLEAQKRWWKATDDRTQHDPSRSTGHKVGGAMLTSLTALTSSRNVGFRLTYGFRTIRSSDWGRRREDDQ